MPRKKASIAEPRAAEAQYARWRYLIRNPEFRKDLQHLSRLKSIKRKIDERERIADKWGLLKVPALAISYAPWLADPQEIATFEPFGKGDEIAYTPVMATDCKEDRFLFFRVDLEHPLDDLLSLIERSLRSVYRLRPRRRRRFDKVDFKLKVYDLAFQGKIFSEIARELNKRASTVKSAYLVARREIFAESEPPTKEELPLKAFEPHNHFQRCSICQKAQTEKDFCAQARLYANLETRAQRELTGYDTTEEAYRKDRKAAY